MAELINLVNPMDWARAHLSAAEFDKLQLSLDRPLNISIRINTLKWDAAEAIQKLSERYGWETLSVPFCDAGYWITKHDLPPSAAIEHRLGYFYIQEAASMLPPELFDFKNNPHIESPLILDMAASPGGKTTHLAARTGDRGLIVANDGSRSRIPALQVVLRNWGAVNQCVTALPGEAFGDLYPDTFDAVLLDAPCSMQGLHAADSHTSRDITVSEIDSLALRQARMLESALRAVKPGGQVVYSTCTLAPQENELVLASILDKFGNAVQIDDVSGKLPALASALTEFDGQVLPDAVKHALRLWPHTVNTAGFFAARLTKLEELPALNSGAWTKSPAKALIDTAPKSLLPKMNALINESYKFSLESLMENQALILAVRKDRLILIPEKLSQFNQLPVISAGMELGRLVREDLIISHEFVSRFGDQFGEGILILENDHLEAWMRGEDLRGYKHEILKAGNIYAVRDEAGRNLGRGKLLADRLKNMLPTRLF